MRKLGLILTPIALLLCSCSLLRDLAQSAFVTPTLTFKNASLADASLGGATVNLVYELENPNPVGISLAEVSYRFSIEGKQVVAGSPAEGLQVPASGRTELSFPASVRFAELVPALEVFLTRDTASYRAEGHLGIQTPIGVIRLPISKEGTFEVPKLPAVQLAPPRVTSVSFAEAQVELPLTVTNRNSFPLPIGGLEGALRISGSQVGSLSTGDLGAIDGRGTRQVNLPVRLRFRDAALALASLGGRTVNLEFSGQIRSGSVSLPFGFNQPINFQR